jgi:predicted aspartyl protease
MGTFKTKLRVWNPAQPEKAEEVEVFVDTGAAFSWVARARLEHLGVSLSRRMPFRRIDDRVLERDLAIVYIGTDGYMAPDLVVMAEPGEMEVMGAHSIEGLGLAADPVQKKLVPTVMPALAVAGVETIGRSLTEPRANS